MKTTKSLIMLITILALALTACGNQPAVTTQQSSEPVAVSSDGIVAEAKFRRRAPEYLAAVPVGEPANQSSLPAATFAA
jgi:hypothetical protein